MLQSQTAENVQQELKKGETCRYLNKHLSRYRLDGTPPPYRPPPTDVVRLEKALRVDDITFQPNINFHQNTAMYTCLQTQKLISETQAVNRYGLHGPPPRTPPILQRMSPTHSTYCFVGTFFGVYICYHGAQYYSGAGRRRKATRIMNHGPPL